MLLTKKEKKKLQPEIALHSRKQRLPASGQVEPRRLFAQCRSWWKQAGFFSPFHGINLFYFYVRWFHRIVLIFLLQTFFLLMNDFDSEQKLAKLFAGSLLTIKCITKPFDLLRTIKPSWSYSRPGDNCKREKNKKKTLWIQIQGKVDARRHRYYLPAISCLTEIEINI